MPPNSNLSFSRLPEYDPVAFNEHTLEELNTPQNIQNGNLGAAIATAGSDMSAMDMSAFQWSGQDSNSVCTAEAADRL